jgi:hypothetical protein
MRFRKRIRSSGTPRDLSTSTAIIADPPVLVSRATLAGGGSHTCGEHGVQEENPAIRNVLGKLVIEQLGHGGLLITLDENLANANRTAAISEALLHGLTGAHDRHTADLALEHETVIRVADGGRDGVLDSGEVVQPFLHEESNDAIRVEDEVRPISVFVADHPIAT